MAESKIDFDVVIVGGGPAGLSSAIWCGDLGLNAALIERQHEIGGQLLRIYNPIGNYPGVMAANGRELRDRIGAQAESSGAVFRLDADPAQIDTVNKTVIFAGGETVRGRRLIIATGVRRRRLGVHGEVELAGRGILESGVGEASAVAGKRVAVIGGGDAALENTLLLSKVAKRVYLIHRRDQFSARRDFVASVRKVQNVDVIMPSVVTAIVGNELVEAIDLVYSGTGDRMILPVENVLVRIGVEPNSDLVRDSLDVDPNGYIVIDHSCETSERGVYAVGDVANPAAPTISGAVGMSAMAVKRIIADIHSFRR